jgi:hypothetical protein
VWDFGRLTKDDEVLYVEAMTDKITQSLKIKNASMLPVISKTLQKLIVLSQHFSRSNQDDRNPVSLRDVNRSLQLFVWFLSIADLEANPFTYPGMVKEQVAIILALAVTYVYKFHGYQEEYLEVLASHSDGLFTSKTFSDCFQQCQQQLIECFSLDDDVVITQTLKENIFLVFVCTQLQIPLLIIGLPATSKSMSLAICLDQMKGHRSAHPFLQQMPSVQGFYLQCSKFTTANVIQECFDQALQFQRTAGNCRSVVVLDEVGLAELNSAQPLKILHGLLDQPDVSFVGISNWMLDSSKMNRAITLFRMLPSLNDLHSLALSVLGTTWSSGRR